MDVNYDCKWVLGYSTKLDSSPSEYVLAAVPGAVQLDWGRAKDYPDYTYNDNYRLFMWMEDVYWTYETELYLPRVLENEGLYLVSKGIDYRYKVFLNKDEIYDYEGMFKGFEIELTGKVKSGDKLKIVIFPVPKREGAAEDRTQADQSCKPAVSYGNDWHPRLVPLGIWEETYLETRPLYHIKNSEVTYELNEKMNNANVQLSIEFSKADHGEIVWRVYDDCCNLIHETKRLVETQSTILDFPFENPKLWWPNGQGEAVLYTSILELFDSEGNLLSKAQSRVGIRCIKLVMHPGAWDSLVGYPKTRNNPPITLEINGRQIFCKGSNWVGPEIFPGTITKETYKPLIKMAKDANMNLLRSWGGGIVNKDTFFEMCDEMGLLVWQEFPLSCNNYIGTPEYLKVLDQESQSIIKRIRSHACLALWSGGNELFNAWSGMTDQSLALRMLNRNCYDLDPKSPFINTSPLMGMAHGNYLFKYDTGEEVFQVMPKSQNTAYTEFGCPSPSDVEYLKTFIPKEELFPPRPGTAWEAHHAIGAWLGDTWLCPSVIEHYFGISSSLEDLVERGQLLQGEGYKCIFEEARRQKPVCSMALNWCFNEPWPTAANNSLINWPAKAKPSYYAVKAALRNTLASARIPKFQWSEGEVFNPELWILNDSPHKLPGGRIEAFIKFEDQEIFLLAWDYSELMPNTNLPGPVIRFQLPGNNSDRMLLVLKAKTVHCEDMNSEYTLLYKRKNNNDNIGTRALNT